MAEQDLAEPLALISQLRTREAPPEIRLFAARLLLPLELDDQLRGLLAVLEDEDEATREAARESFATIPPDRLSQFLKGGSPTAIELDAIARLTEDQFVLEQIIQHKNVDDETLKVLARSVTGGPQEAFVVNQVRLLRQPSLIDALFENPELTPDARRRLLEVREEFFDKEKRRKQAEAAQAQEAVAAAAEAEAARDLAALTPEEANARTGGPFVEDDLEKSLTTGAAYRRIAVMTVSEKIKLAYSGGKEERRILMGDANKLVGSAVLKSRGLTINEVESFCSLRQLHEELFRKMASNREWIRNPGVVVALVKNPRVPLAITMPLVKRLPIRDLKSIDKDPNLPDGVRITARKWLAEKRK